MSNIPKWLFVGIGTIILGGIGSGLWEVVLKPGMPWLFEGVLNVATLGFSAAKDNLYLEVAKGNLERSSVDLLNAFAGIVLSFSLFIAFVWRQTTKAANVSAKSKLAWMDKRAAKTGLILTICLCGGFFSVLSIRETYIVRAAAHIEQLQVIDAPYLSDSQRAAFASRAAQLTSREDYDNLRKDLIAVAKLHKLVIPTFNVF